MSLILTRRTGETLMIGDDITVTVMGCQGNQVRIAINAPRDVEVHREEIYRLIQQERLANERELIRGLYVVEFRRIADDRPLCWVATKTTAGAEAVFLSEFPEVPLSAVSHQPVWDPLMACYIGTAKEREGDIEKYAALVAAAEYGTAEPFRVPMPGADTDTTSREKAA